MVDATPDNPPGARIIAFPLRPREAAPEVTDNGSVRLQRALAALDAAVAGQREAVAAWRSALADLRTVMAGLGESMQRYRSNLDSLGERVAGLHGQARQLERIADSAISGARE